MTEVLTQPNIEVDLKNTYVPTSNPAPKKQEFQSIKCFELFKNAQLLMKSGEASTALVLLRQASNLESKNLKVLSLLCDVLQSLKKISEQECVLKEMNRIESSFASCFKYAQCLYRAEKDSEALRAYFECMSYVEGPFEDLFEVYKNVGNILVKMRDFDGAEEYYQKAFNINKSSDQLLVNFGTLEIQRGDMTQALYCLRTAAEINPQNPKAWIGLAMVHRQMGDIELAQANLQKAVDLDQMNRTALMLMATWAESVEEKKVCADRVQAFLSEQFEDVEMSLVLIQLLAQSLQSEEARLEVCRSFYFNPNNNDVSQIFQSVVWS